MRIHLNLSSDIFLKPLFKKKFNDLKLFFFTIDRRKIEFKDPDAIFNAFPAINLLLSYSTIYISISKYLFTFL